MIRRGGRYQTAQLTYIRDNSVFMPEQNLRYLSKFPCNTYFFTPLRCLSDYLKESFDSLWLAMVNKVKVISTKWYFKNLVSLEISVFTKKSLHEVRKLLERDLIYATSHGS